MNDNLVTLENVEKVFETKAGPSLDAQASQLLAFFAWACYVGSGIQKHGKRTTL